MRTPDKSLDNYGISSTWVFTFMVYCSRTVLVLRIGGPKCKQQA